MGLKTTAILVALFAAGAYWMFGRSTFDPASVRNKRVLVTGASTGIGEQLAYRYAELGARLALTARRETVLQSVADRCRKLGSPHVEVIAGDMGDGDHREEVAREAVRRFGGLDYLVLNHVISEHGLWHGGPQNGTVLRKVMDVNFFAYVDLASRLLGALAESDGAIAVLSSVAGNIGMPRFAPYSASKFALQGFFSALRQELAQRRVDVAVTVCVLGLIDTENAMNFAHQHTPNMDVEMAASARDTAAAIVESVAARERTMYYPFFAFVAVKMHQLFPATVDYLILQKMF